MPKGSIDTERPIRVPANVVDLARFRAWAHSPDFPESGRVSYIAGKIEVEMSPEEIESHNKLKTRLLLTLGAWVDEVSLGELLSDGVLYVHEEADIATEPDLIFAHWDTLRRGAFLYRERVHGSQRYVEAVGSPDLVVEVVSRSSVQKDTVHLLERYFQAGVSEYWIADARGPEVRLRVLNVASATKRYVEAPPDSDGFSYSAVFKRAFRVIKEANPVGAAAYRVIER